MFIMYRRGGGGEGRGGRVGNIFIMPGGGGGGLANGRGGSLKK
jgi:hypothetical protein